MAASVDWSREWIPLLSQQLRLRSLTQIVAFNVHGRQNDENSEQSMFYFTLHMTSKSAPFYSSEPRLGPNPRWAEINLQKPCDLLTSTGLVIRIWQCGSPDHLVTVWGLYFSGLVPVPPGTNLYKELGNNALVFYMHACPFIAPSKMRPVTKFAKSMVEAGGIRRSYSISELTRLHQIQLDTAKNTVTTTNLKERISLVKPFQSTGATLQTPGERLKVQALLFMREEANHRLSLLRGEKAKRVSSVQQLQAKKEKLEEEVQEMSVNLTAHYRSLSREMERLRESRLGATQTQDALVQTTLQLANRRRQLISQLKLIYPIQQNSHGVMRICDVPLLSSELLPTQNESSSAVALGFATHATVMVATFLDVPLRYPVVPCGSRARVWDVVAPKLPDSEREFPLFSRGRDKIQFNYAVYLLNKNIAQLRWYCGLSTKDLRLTLNNLQELFHLKPHSSRHKRTLSGSSIEIPVRCVPSPQPLTDQHTTRLHEEIICETFTKKELSDEASLHSLDRGTPIGHQVLLGGSQKEIPCWHSGFPKHATLREGQVVEQESTPISCSLDKGLDNLVTLHSSKKSIQLISTAINASEPNLNHAVREDPSYSDSGKRTRNEKSRESSAEEVCCKDDVVGTVMTRKNDEHGMCDATSMQLDPGVENSCHFTIGVSDTDANVPPVTPNDSCSLLVPCEHAVDVTSVISDEEKQPSCDDEVHPSFKSDNSTLHLEKAHPQLVCDQDSPMDFSEYGSIERVFASVASRTEALATKSGSFNLVRPRTSTSESS